MRGIVSRMEIGEGLSILFALELNQSPKFEKEKWWEKVRAEREHVPVQYDDNMIATYAA